MGRGERMAEGCREAKGKEGRLIGKGERYGEIESNSKTVYTLRL